MKKKEKIVYVLIFVVVCISCFPATAYAYIDPMTGSMVLQALGAVVIAAGGAWAVFRGKIKSFFSRGKTTETSDADKSEDSAQEAHEDAEDKPEDVVEKTEASDQDIKE